MGLHFAPAPATYTTRRASRFIELWEWRVTWCQDGARHEKFGFARTRTRAEERGQQICDRINDPEMWWDGNVPRRRTDPVIPPPPPGFERRVLERDLTLMAFDEHGNAVDSWTAEEVWLWQKRRK